jgi:anti-sigma regulatory factor (Ser/Thr protein kinase)
LADELVVAEWFRPDLASARRARYWAEPVLASWNVDGELPSVMIVLSELVTNAVQHAGTKFFVEVARTDTGVRVSVHDGSDTLPVVRDPSPEETRGRGLVAVGALTSRWGVEPVVGGKIVWAEVDCRAPNPALS